MADENVNENDETTEETTAEPETTDAPEGAAPAEEVSESVSEEAAPEPAAVEEAEEPAAGEAEPAGGAEPPGGEPATEEPEEAPEAVGEGPAAEAEPEEAAAEEAEPAEAEPAEAEPAAAEAAPEPAAPTKKRRRLPRSLRRVRTKPERERPAERKAITRLPKPEHMRGRRQERQGTVVSANADKTIVVRVDTVKVHPMYKKVIRRSTKLHAHDESNQAKIGDIVRIVETRPISKLKRWRLQEVVQEAK
jgi:small subunit ribosomal protein S17